jgi:hypothetical protein
VLHGIVSGFPKDVRHVSTSGKAPLDICPDKTGCTLPPCDVCAVRAYA